MSTSPRATRPTRPGAWSPGSIRAQPVYGYRFAGEWFDIGDRTQLLEADNRMRRLHGLAERAEYSLEQRRFCHRADTDT